MRGRTVYVEVQKIGSTQRELIRATGRRDARRLVRSIDHTTHRTVIRELRS